MQLQDNQNILDKKRQSTQSLHVVLIVQLCGTRLIDPASPLQSWATFLHNV